MLSPNSKIYACEGCPIWATPNYLTFFLGTVSQLIWHTYGLFDTKYQMSVCDDGKGSVQNSAAFPTLLLKSSKKVVFLSEISSK